GALGKRTQFQQKFLAQLVLQVHRKDQSSGAHEDSPTCTPPSMLPKNCRLNDDTLLEDVSLARPSQADCRTCARRSRPWSWESGGSGTRAGLREAPRGPVLTPAVVLQRRPPEKQPRPQADGGGAPRLHLVRFVPAQVLGSSGLGALPEVQTGEGELPAGGERHDAAAGRRAPPPPPTHKRTRTRTRTRTHTHPHPSVVLQEIVSCCEEQTCPVSERLKLFYCSHVPPRWLVQ
ncbi:unnamed protein product, partial [Tetraodon nigroviridis]